MRVGKRLYWASRGKRRLFVASSSKSFLDTHHEGLMTPVVKNPMFWTYIYIYIYF